jgi:hypothetical protein
LWFAREILPHAFDETPVAEIIRKSGGGIGDKGHQEAGFATPRDGGTGFVTILDTVGCETPRRSPRNSCVAFRRSYLQVISIMDGRRVVISGIVPHAIGR